MTVGNLLVVILVEMERCDPVITTEFLLVKNQYQTFTVLVCRTIHFQPNDAEWIFGHKALSFQVYYLYCQNSDQAIFRLKLHPDMILLDINMLGTDKINGL